MKLTAVLLLLIVGGAGCSRPLRNAGLVTSAGLVGGGVYVVEDSKCSGQYCVDLGGNAIGGMLVVSGMTLALVSVIASELVHQNESKRATKP